MINTITKVVGPMRSGRTHVSEAIADRLRGRGFTVEVFDFWELPKRPVRSIAEFMVVVVLPEFEDEIDELLPHKPEFVVHTMRTAR